ncbi:hypothetical protein JD844_014556 [Phrynosoma platyrhinos]|uniref:Exonuclease domain-containing protein n=1 Tax=Phrynosoma platyrhinos TaxID=52577 RepID=A0ABQ7SRV4_PHRPL|nr:hypothetical protein JD844_014556 [Phrynosoma platyrhinos]
MDGQVLKCSCSSWSPNHILHEAHEDSPSASQSKKKSRKHQRFTMRRALEQKGHLGTRSREKILLRTLDAYRTGRSQDTLPWEASHNSLLLEENVVKIHKNLVTPCPVVSFPSACQTKQPSSSQDLKAAFPSSSAKDMASLSSLKLKKPKKCVAIDCEMVGTGPAGKMSALARCTVVNYDGDVIYDKYIRPELPVVDYRTRWSGVTRRHMANATPFKVAQGEVSKKGHSSVEDAQTSMELYQLVDIEWEQELASSFSSSPPDSGTDSDCYMDDQYWPEDLDVDCK